MAKKNMEDIKNLGMVIGIVASIVGAGIAFGINSNAIANTIKTQDEIKSEQHRKRAILLEHSKILERVSTQLTSNSKMIERIQKKMDRGSVN